MSVRAGISQLSALAFGFLLSLGAKRASAQAMDPMLTKQPAPTDVADETSVPIDTRTRGTFGVRGALTRAGDGLSGNATSFVFSGMGEEVHTAGLLTAHGTHFWAIGGGTAGFDGALSGAIGVGPRLPLGRHSGIATRVGLRGFLRGNDVFYGSLFELPRGELGWQIGAGRSVFEIGATGGAALVGRFSVGGAPATELGAGFAWGGYGLLQLPHVQLGGTWERLPVHDVTSQHVDATDAFGCAFGDLLSVCADLRAMRGDVPTATGATTTTSWTAGLLLGLAPAQTPMRKNAWTTEE